MTRLGWFSAVLLLTIAVLEARSGSARAAVAFEPNRGQSDRSVHFLARKSGYAAFFTSEGVTLARGGDVLRMQLVGAERAPRIEPDRALPGVVHYARPGRAGERLAALPRYAALRYRQVYPGVDWVFHGDRGPLEHDFIVSPGVDPARIALRVSGHSAIEPGASGSLRLQLGSGAIELGAPLLYQEIDGERRPVEGAYRLDPDGTIGFRVGAYDPGRTLVIDPAIVASTYLGGSGEETPFGDVVGVDLAIGPDGGLYVAGFSSSSDFPGGAAGSPVSSGAYDAFVTKLDPSGSEIEFTTFLGGVDLDAARAVQIDGDGNIYLAGYTESVDFPTTTGAFQEESRDTRAFDAFAAKLSPEGDQLLWSTYLGGTEFDVAFAMDIDSQRRMHLAGRSFSSDFPTAMPIQAEKVVAGNVDAWVAMLSADGSTLEYSTYLGGDGDDAVFGLVVGDDASTYLVGRTYSTNFPTTPGAFYESHGPRVGEDFSDAFVAKVDPTGSALVFSTLLGGSRDDWGFAIALDATQHPYVTGRTSSTDGIATAGAFQSEAPGAGDQFVAKLEPDGSALVHASYLGGTRLEGLVPFLEPELNFLSFEGLTDVAVDEEGRAYVTGNSFSEDFPAVGAGAQPDSIPPSSDALLSVFSADGASLLFSTRLGGSGRDLGTAIELDGDDEIVVAGATGSGDFPLLGAAQAVFAGAVTDAFVTRFSAVPEAGAAMGALTSLAVLVAIHRRRVG